MNLIINEEKLRERVIEFFKNNVMSATRFSKEVGISHNTGKRWLLKGMVIRSESLQMIDIYLRSKGY